MDDPYYYVLNSHVPTIKCASLHRTHTALLPKRRNEHYYAPPGSHNAHVQLPHILPAAARVWVIYYYLRLTKPHDDGIC